MTHKTAPTKPVVEGFAQNGVKRPEFDVVLFTDRWPLNRSKPRSLSHNMAENALAGALR